MRVDNGIGGSVCVVYPSKNPEHYVDARKDVRYPGMVLLEAVFNGQVYARNRVALHKAPEAIKLMFPLHSSAH